MSVDYPILNGIVAIASVVGLSAACAYIKERQFSAHIFMVACGIGVAILVWIPMLPFYFIVLAIILAISPIIGVSLEALRPEV